MRLARAFERVHARPETSERRAFATSRPPRARPRLRARPETREDARGAFPSPPELDDVLLLLGDVTVVWLFELAKKVSAVSLREDFPGWLAPSIEISAKSAAAFGTEAFTAIASWVTLSAFVSNAYATRYDETPTVSRAMDECVKTWVVWAPVQAGAAAVAVKSGLGQTATHAPTISLLVALGAMLAWRTYAKVFSLLAPSRAGNEATDDVEFGTFYGVFGGVAALTIAVAVAQLWFYGGGERELI